MHDIAIIGAGGFAKEVAFLIDDINKKKKVWNVIGYIDKNNSDLGKNNGKYKIFNTDHWVINYKNRIHVAFAIGDPQIIYKLSEQYKLNDKIIYPNLVHPSVIGDWKRINIGIGNIVCAGSILTTEIKIGSFNIINLNCVIGHDNVIGNYNVINPSAMFSGSVIMQNRNLVGTHSKIIQGIKIDSDIKIGVGSIVMTNISKKGTYFGIPAKILK